jgi:hypothetical protein
MQGSSPYFNLNDLAGSETPPEKPPQIVDITSRPAEPRIAPRKDDAGGGSDKARRTTGRTTKSRLDPDD